MLRRERKENAYCDPVVQSEYKNTSQEFPHEEEDALAMSTVLDYTKAKHKSKPVHRSAVEY